jgi:hypothetical protein
MKFTLLFLGTLFAAQASAGVYKCTDANGKTDYRSKPCEVGRSAAEINVKTGSSINLDQEAEKQQLQQQEQEKKQSQEKMDEQLAQQKQARLKQDAQQESAKNHFLINNNPDKFSAFAIPLYDYDQLPALVKEYQSRLPDIERLRRRAAEKALASGQCGRV